MKRFLALLALVVVLMLGTAGMVSATTIAFDAPPLTSPNPPYPPEINGITNLTWDGDGWYGGHLWVTNVTLNTIISFTSATYVNSFQMNGMANMSMDPNTLIYGPMNIEAFNADVKVWGTTVEFDEDHRDLTNFAAWLTMDVNAAVSKIIFYSPNPGYSTEINFYASIDNLVINEGDPVPIPAAVWLLVSGLLGLVGLRRKVTC